MTKILVISDIHANLTALETVLADAGKVDEVWCLGDIAGYGPDPNECIERLCALPKLTCMMGNHDYAAITGDVSGFNSRAAIAALWTSKQLTEENRHFLAGLPREMKVDLPGARLYITHGSPDDNLWEYLFPATHSDIFGYYLKKLSVDVIGVGHSHVPFTWQAPEGTVFNPGSVGQPRDGDPRACYAVLSLAGGEVAVRHHRVGYDIETSARKVIDAGLPDTLARRLFSGE